MEAKEESICIEQDDWKDQRRGIDYNNGRVYAMEGLGFGVRLYRYEIF